MRTAYKGTNRLWMLLIAMLLVCGMAFGAIAEEGAAQTGTNDLDGSKIEGVKVIWVTQDSATTAEGDPTPEAELKATDHLYLSSVSDSPVEMVYRIEAEFSGQYDYAPGDITITIPAQVWHGRKYEETGVEGETVGVVDENRLLGYLELPVPAAPSKKADFNWQIIDGNYVLTNTRTIGATSSVSIEVGIRGIRPVDVVDMSETAPITAHVEVVTNQGNTIELTSTPITAQLDTQARITDAYKNGEVFEDYPGLDEKLLANLPADANPNDYIYVRWYTYHSHNNNQPYSLDIADVLSDAYEKVVGEDGQVEEKYVTDGIFLGSTNYEGQVLNDGEIDFTAEIGDHFTTTTTGTQYANTVYMWSAYKKSDFDVPSANERQRVYYFKNEVTWTLTETDKTVEDSGNGKGEDPQKVTTAKDDVILPYAPVKWQRPRGAFAVNKWTERVGYKDWLYGYALNLLERREEVDMDFIVETVGYGYPWTSKLTRDYSYGELNNTVVNGDLEKLELDASAFGKLGWKQVTDDFQTFFNFETEPLTSEDFEFKSLRVSVPGKMRYAKKSNGTWDYVSDSTLPTPDLMIEYQLNNEDTWYPAATATWGEDGLGEFRFVDVNEAAGVTTSGMTVFFPENVTDTRHTFISNVFDGKMAEQCDIAMLDWYVYPTITMKSSDRVYGIVQELFEQSENPSTKFRNDVIMDAYGWVGSDDEAKVLDDDYDYSMATYEGASYGVALTKSGTSESDAENQRLVIHYTATLTEQSNLKERSDYDAAVEAGVIPAETSGIWYDLLPPHVVPLLDTVKLRKDDTITNVYTVEDYKGTGRTLLVVEAELTPVPASYNSIGYADRPRLEFDAAYTWMDMDEYGKELVNYVAFESTVENLRNDTLGTIKNQKGDPDTPAGGNNANTPSMPEDIIKALTDLDPNTDENRFVYDKYSHTVSSLTYAVSGLQKAVKNDLVGIWTQGLDGQEQVTVYEGHYYTYSLRVSSAENTATKGIVIYDTIENYIIPDPDADEDTDATKRADYEHTQERKDWSGYWKDKGQWRGTLTQVDLSEFVKAKVKPVLLYSTIDNLQFADSSSESTDDNFDEDTELFSSGSYDITDREIWQVAELDENGIWQVPEDVAVTAVAIDATTTTDGKEFVLRPEEALAGYLKMRAPDDDSDENTWKAKGAYARKADNPAEIDWEAAVKAENNMYAYNNARVRLMQGNSKTTTQIDPETGKEVVVENTTWLSNLRMIRNDYTRVGIVPEIVTVEKTWQDQDNHDAMRPESVTINVLRRLAGTAGEAQPVLDKDGQPLTAVLDESNGWKAEFKQVDIVNEDGVRYLYTFEEEPVEGYTSKVQFIDVNHYTMINVHPNEQVDISGEKTWSDDNNALGFRPAVVTLKLYRDGEQIDTRIVKPNGAGEWKYTFGKLDKYAEGGKEYKYKVEEEYVPKYVGEANGYEMVNNTYIPVGALEVSKTLVGATDAAKDKEFTFTLVLLAEQTDPRTPAVPLMDKYAYTIYTLEGEEWVEDEIGEIGNSGTFKLKDNQKIVVYDLPSEATYEVVESEAAGFTSKATDADGSIRAGQTVQAAFVNEYKASGSVQLNVGKSLTGHAIRKNQFRFELVDNNPDSSTYGEVIRTARVEAPEEDATTGGSGKTIESLTQAIFGQLEYTQDDHGNTYNYQVREVDTGKDGYTADAKVYDVAVSVTDNGDGTMTVTPAYTDAAGDAVTELKFKNEYHAEGELTLKAWKTLEGRELKEGEFTFELYSYDAAKNGLGEKLGEATNDAEGNIVFDALEFDENDVSLDENNPATYTYLIREKQGTDKTVAYSNQEYVMTVTVFDNGDGTLSFAQGSQGYSREYITCPTCQGLKIDQFQLIRETSIGQSTDGVWKAPYDYAFVKLCTVCNGWAQNEDTSLNGTNGYCSSCGGSGLEANQTIYYPDGERIYTTVGNNEEYKRRTRMMAKADEKTGFFTLPSNFSICDNCYGEGTLLGPLTITGDVTIPVFANELKPGDLTVTKQVQGEGSSNPDQTFNFTIKLTGEVPEDLDYGMTAPTPAPTATPEVPPAPEVTPKPAAVRNTPKPTTQPTVMPTTKPAEPFKATKQEGDGFAIINLTTNEMVFFRAVENANGVYTYNGKASGDTDVFFSFADVEAGIDYMTVTAPDGTSYQIYRNIESNSDHNWPWGGGEQFKKSVISVTMEGEIVLNKTATNMFQNFAAATIIDLSLLDTSNVTEMNSMFHSCEKLETLVVSGFDTSKVTNFANMFYGCQKLKELNLSSFNTSEVQNFGSMFSNCKALSELKLENFDTHSATNMENMFFSCGNLQELKLSTFNTSSVTSMRNMFYGCSGLTELDLGSFSTSNVTNMNSMFRSCSSLPSLDLSTFNTSSVTNMSYMFYDCSSLTSLDLSTFSTSNVTNMSYMLLGCESLTSLDLSTFNTSKVTDMTSMFTRCRKLANLDVSTFETGKVSSMSSMFARCNDLKELDLSNFNTSNVKSMGLMFYECSSLRTLDLSNFDTAKVTDMREMLAYCSGLTTVDISNFDTGKVTDMRSMFAGSKSIMTISIGANTVLSQYPSIPSAITRYTGKWVNVDDEDKVLAGADLFPTGSNAGTWTRQLATYQLAFAPGEGGAGAMPSVKVTCGEAYSFVPQFYQFGYDLIGFVDDKGVTYNLSGDLVTIPAYTYTNGQTVTLTAVWQKRDVTVSESGDTITFALKAGETFTLSDLPASLAYEVWEELPTGWVLVEKKDDTGVIKPLETSEAVFTNKYQPEKAQAILRASKLLDGEAPESGEFSFTLSEGDTPIETVTNDGSGVVFAPITYEKEDVGAHTYTIKEEVEGTDTTINYDAAEYTVKVEVTDDGQGNLSAEVTYLDADGKELTEPPVFKNTTKPGALFIRKDIIGATEKAKEQVFTFEVTFTDELLNVWKTGTVSLKGGESITVADIPAGLKYEVKETGSYPGWTMDGTIKEGKIASNETAEVTFTNAYTLTGVASIEAKKVLVGRDLTAGEFTFQLVGENNNVVAEATNGADGRVLFPQMTYTEEGTWEYVIVEAKPNEDKIDNTVEYSGQRIEVTVTAKDEKGDGTLTTSVAYSPEKTPITNTLKPGALQISKTVMSSNPDHAEKVFTFTVTLTDAEGAPLNGSYTLNETLALPVQNGKVEITLKGGETATISKLPAGTQYSVTEAKEAGFTTEMTGDSGVIMPNETAYAAFTNTYAAEGEYAIEGIKTLEGADLTAEQFTFELTMPQADGSETVLETVTNDEDGKITFSKLIFTDLDEGEYVYRIREVNDRKPGFTYDDTVYEFTLIVKDNSDGTMTITPEGLPEGGIEFKNTYNDKTSVSVEKVWADEENKLGVRPVSVTVELYRNGEKREEVVLDAENVWKHTFSELPAFDENGVTYTYTVKELPVTGYDGMQSVKDGVNVFTNTVQGVLDVTKTVVAGMDAEKEFAFTVTLTKADEPLTTEVILEKADVREAVKPDAEGKVRFTLKDGETARLIGLPIGVEYKVEEAPEAGYTATMENAEGLIQRFEKHTAVFTNTYEATGDITFEGTKTISGRKMTEKDIFTFEVSENGTTNTWTVQNGADGKIVYPTIEYIHNAEKSDLGEHTYTVKETSTNGKGITVAKNTYTVTVNVSDKGDGKLKVEPSDNYTKLNFVNTYKATGDITFEGIKTIDGRKMTEKDIFAFEVSENGTTNTWTVQSGADGKIVYPTIEYIHNAEKSDLGEHTYTVKETSTDGKGITVATNSYTVTVNVSDNGDGTLKVEPSDNYTKLNFVNTYKATGDITFEGIKTIDGRKMTEKDIFAFEVSENDTTNTWTVQNGADGKIVYPTIEYIHNAEKSDLGEHTYTVKETSTDSKGITVDTKTYEVTVTVTDNGDGTLKVVATDNAKALIFTNTYEAKGKVDFSGVKALEGRALKEGEFSFILQDKDGKEIETVKNGKEGEITFTTLEYIHNAKQSDLGEHTYTVKEVKGDLDGVTYDETAYEVTVTVTDNGDGTLKVIASDNHKALNFTNTYEAKGKVDFSGVKKLEGRELKEGEFSFILLDKDGKEIETVKNGVDGKIAFTTLNYIHNAKQSDLGDHTYTVKEVKGDLDGVTYDETTYEIKVTVTDNGDGTLNVVASDNHKALDFKNTYGAKGKADFIGLKKLEGRELKEGEFSFILQDKDGKEIETVKNGKEGKITFTTLEYIHNAKQSDLGEHTYTVKEVQGDLDGVTYDETVYTIKVTVTDNGDGTLKVVASDNAKALNFTNTYEATGNVTFEGMKTLEGRELKEGEFSFILLDKDGKEIETVKNGKEGKITFTTLEYIHNAKQSDLGEYTYTVKEVQGDLDGVTYDETAYEIKVTVTDNGDGTLKVLATDNHKALNFVNTYEADGTVRFKGTKQLVGREFRNGDAFLFELVENGVTIQRSRLTPVEGKEAAFEFNPIKYATEDIGTHTYLIREEKGSIKGVSYDATEYTVTVTVADAGNGKLSVSKAITADGKAAESIVFTNTYEAKGELTLTAEKTVNGIEPTADQVFDFTLSDADGEIETVQNKLGEIEFAKLTYTLDDLGEHTYTVKENKTDKAGYAIDETVYTVKVNVTDNGDGTLKAEKKITANGKTVEGMIFDNKHSATLTISKKVEGCTTEETFPIKVWLFDAKGNELKGEYAYTGDVTGKLTSGEAIELGHGQTITIEDLPVGSRYKVEETKDPRFTTTVNSLAMNTAEGEIVEGGNTAAFVNRLITTMFKVRKEWQGGDGGTIILTLYANGEKLEDQPAYTQEGDMYYYTGLPMYDEDGDEIIYSAKEKYVDGFLTIYKNVEPYAEETKAIYNGGTIINKAITTIKVQKVWSGLAEGAEVPEITLILHCNGEVYDRKTPKPDSDGWYVYSNLPEFVNGERAVYSVTEEPMEGCSTIYTNNGEEGDCAYNGGTITNIVVPKTGDDAPVELWMAAMLLSAAALVMMARRRKA